MKRLVLLLALLGVVAEGLVKAGDGAASAKFDGRAIGSGFPDTSVDWYRKTIEIPAGDFERQLFHDFDGVSRDAKVLVQSTRENGEIVLKASSANLDAVEVVMVSEYQ